MTAGAAGLFRQLEQWFLDSWATIKMGFMQDLLGLYNMNLLICRNEYYFFPTNFEWNSRWLIWDSKKKNAQNSTYPTIVFKKWSLLFS